MEKLLLIITQNTLAVVGVMFALMALSWLMFHQEETNTLFYLTVISAVFIGLSGTFKK